MLREVAVIQKLNDIKQRCQHLKQHLTKDKENEKPEQVTESMYAEQKQHEKWAFVRT